MTQLINQTKQDSLKEIVKIAKSMLKEEVNLIEGSRKINKLRYNTANPDDDIFNPFILFVSDTDSIPIGEDIRKNYGAEYLKRADKELYEYIKDMKPTIFRACKEIVEKISTRLNIE